MLCVLCAVPVFSVITSPTGVVEGAVVGNTQAIQCTISTVSGVTANSVIINWIGPSGASITNNSRIFISSLSYDSGNYSTSSLKFMYLMEGDEGMYMCNVSILQTNASAAVEVGALIGTVTFLYIKQIYYASLYYAIVPTPIVSVAVQTNQTAGEPLTLYCNVTTVRGITSRVDIMWLVDDSLLEIAVPDISSTSDDMQLYMTSYTIDQLSATDNERAYQCKVLINSRETLVTANDNFTLNVTGK